MQETQVLEAEQARLKEEIQSFQKEKDELEFILDTHRAHCGPSTVGNHTAAVSSMSADVAGRSSSVSVSSADTSLSAMADSGRNLATAIVSRSISDVSVAADVRQVTAALPSASTLVSHAVGIGCRPSYLHALSTGKRVADMTSTAGTNLLTAGLDSLADGHTGLTPLTGIPSGPILVVGMPLATMSASNSDSSSAVGFL